MVRIIKPSYEFEDFDALRILENIEKAGRTCYKSEGKITDGSAERFVSMVIERGHESVLEHEKISVRIICDRGVTHEIVRHRIASYSQESTRYCNYGKGKFGNEITVIDPWPYIHGAAYSVWFAAMGQCEQQYLKLLEMDVSPQLARDVLPNSLKTEIVCTFNLREWRHFFRLRCSKAAHPQLRQISIPMLREMMERLPAVFQDIAAEVQELQDGE